MLQYVVHGGWWMVYGCQQSAMSRRPSTIDCILKLRLFAVRLITIIAPLPKVGENNQLALRMSGKNGLIINFRFYGSLSG